MKSEILQDLRKSIATYDVELAVRAAKKAVEEQIDLLEAVEAMTSAIRDIGERFGRHELWLPDLVGAAKAMSAAMPIIDAELKKGGGKKGTFLTALIGTVKGDMHTIGKDMVRTLLIAEGFNVHDLGTNVSAEQFVTAVKKYSPDVVAMSALMTTTSPEQRNTIETLKREGLRDKVKVIVGGGAITQKFADSIGADGYHPTAPGGAKLAKKLVER